MSESDDEYLWSGEGAPSEDMVAIEQTLGVLRWRPQALVLPGEGDVSVREARPRERERGSWWPMLAAGLVAAAAVLALLMWRGGSTPEIEAPQTTVDPTAPPPSPDLKDPFGPSQPSAPTVDTESPKVPDLKDPFGNLEQPEPPRERERKPKRPTGPSPDLKDPFRNSPSEQEPAGKLLDPFGGAKQDPQPRSSDLKDPFSSPSELDAQAEAGKDR